MKAWEKKVLKHKKWRKKKSDLVKQYQFEREKIRRLNDEATQLFNVANDRWLNANKEALRIVTNFRRELALGLQREVFPATGRVPWHILPPGETGEERVLSYLRDFQRRHPEYRIDESRLHFAYTLRPEQVFIGEDEFDGYVVFVFDDFRKVLLDNPIEGNAAYIFGSDWQSLSRLSKTELLQHHQQELVRVTHRGEWKLHIKRVLQRG